MKTKELSTLTLLHDEKKIYNAFSLSDEFLANIGTYMTNLIQKERSLSYNIEDIALDKKLNINEKIFLLMTTAKLEIIDDMAEACIKCQDPTSMAMLPRLKSIIEVTLYKDKIKSKLANKKKTS